MTKGWWRRNVWGLLLILPLIGGILAFEAKDFYRSNYTMLPKEPVPVDGTGRAVLNDYAARLIEVRPVETEAEVERVSKFGRPKLPSNVKIWRAMVAIEAPADSFVSLCSTSLEDERGRRYEKAPSELGGDSRSFGGCSPDDDEQPVPYTSTFYFVLPADARPTALLITWDDRLPRFIRFSIP